MPVSKIFVSHAVRDQEIAEAVVELLQLGSGVPGDQIFFSSGSGMGVPAGSRFNEHIRAEVKQASLVVAILSPAFRESAFSIAEIGAAWVLQSNFFPLMVPSFGHSDLDGVLVGVQVQSLDAPEALAELDDRARQALGLSGETTRWAKQQAKFLARLGDLSSRLDGPSLVPYEQLQGLETERDGAQSALKDAEAEKREIGERLQAVLNAKSAEEAVAVSLPAGQEARFEQLRATAKSALGELPRAVQSAIACDVRGEQMPVPSRFDDQHGFEEITENLRDGYLEEGSDENVVPARDVRVVEAAIEAVYALQDFFDEAGEEFEANFKQRFGAPPDLKKGLVWNEILANRRGTLR